IEIDKVNHTNVVFIKMTPRPDGMSSYKERRNDYFTKILNEITIVIIPLLCQQHLFRCCKRTCFYLIDINSAG
ncbi:MAG TPA: hypothetical protein PKA80_14925, partial [Ignavibacteriaceae bacterium]|nr:hypothetical protein [Ignavibacteriaceae bacterium]